MGIPPPRGICVPWGADWLGFPGWPWLLALAPASLPWVACVWLLTCKHIDNKKNQRKSHYLFLIFMLLHINKIPNRLWTSFTCQPNWPYISKPVIGSKLNFIWIKMFIAPIHETLDTKFLRLDKSIHSSENLRNLHILASRLFSGNTLVTTTFPFMGDIVNLSDHFHLSL